jgi:hypothetical protein
MVHGLLAATSNPTQVARADAQQLAQGGGVAHLFEEGPDGPGAWAARRPLFLPHDCIPPRRPLVCHLRMTML